LTRSTQPKPRGRPMVHSDRSLKWLRLSLRNQTCTTKLMLSKFTIEYAGFPHQDQGPHLHRTDDPVEAEDFLTRLLILDARILSIKHEGIDLAPHQFDRMLKVAAERLASQLLGKALGIDGAAVKHRFGFAP